ncbi:unnamed protein product [Rotaria sp. Silwood2]|nr:unnamed protein product [Rotaria sp. Silwood2]
MLIPLYRYSEHRHGGDMEYPNITGPHGRAGILRGSGVAWPNGIVPYIFAPGYTYEQELIITAAMRMLENTVADNNYRCVQFRPRNLSDPYYIIFYNGEGCSSYVGQNPGIVLNRTVTLQSSGCLGVGTIMHELLHALGFEHEQSRPDRDAYVTIKWANIQAGMEYNFDKYDNNTVNTYGTPYDYGSLMHYSQYAFSVNGLPTIESNQANVTLGQRSNLSVYDVQALRRFYNCTASGTTLPPTTTPAPLNIYGVNVTYSSTWTTSSRKFIRRGQTTANYYYETYQVNVSTAGYYRFKSSSSLDTYGYLYINNFLPSSTSLNLLGEDDDNGLNSQFQFTFYLQPNTVYILVATTYSEGITGPYTVIVSGATRVTLVPVTNTSTVITTTIAPVTTITSTYPPNAIITSYSSLLNNASSTFTRSGGSGTYFYEAIKVIVNATGNYTVQSNCSIDSYGYLYVNSFNPSNVALNLVASNDDSGGNNQFLIAYTLQAGTTYILIFTTYLPNVTTPFSIMAWGSARVSLTRLNMVSSTTSTTTTTSMITISGPNVINITGIVTNYSSLLNTTSPTFTRNGTLGIFYFEAIKVIVNATGNYTVQSNCSIDSYGYLYLNNFNSTNVALNLVASNDDSGGNNQFLITYTLQAGTTYILIFTTYLPNVTTPFSIMARGPARLGLQYINMRNGSGSITTVTSTSTTKYSTFTTTTPVICNGSSIRLTCPVQVVTNGIIFTLNPPNRNLSGGYVIPNNTFFNLNDSSTVNGYVRTVSVRYVQSRLPTASTRIWIYGIIPILGGYMACSQYLVPFSQISTTQLKQTYNITANVINVFPGTYIAVGIQDGLTSIATTSGTIAFSVGSANLTSNIIARTPLYFRPDNSGFGVNVSYTIMK